MLTYQTDEEATLLQNEDSTSHHSAASTTKRNMAKKEILGILQVIRHPEYNKAVIAVMMVMLAQQLCGKHNSP